MSRRSARARFHVVAFVALAALVSACDAPPAGDPDGGTSSDDDARVPPGDGSVPPSDGASSDGASADGGGGGADAGAMPVVPDADPTFGAGGMALVNIAHEWIGPVWSLVVQPDGKIVAGGRSADAFVVLRAFADGTLDPSFGRGGMASIPVGGPVFTPTTAMGLGSIALAPDGSVLVATLLVPLDRATQRELVARLTPAGALDTSFGDGGVVVGDHTVPEGAIANAVAVQADGRIVVAARDHVDRLLPDGSPDPSFASGGRFSSALGGAWADYQALVIDSAGRIVVSGAQGAVGVGRRVFVMRLTASGELDASFAGGAGHVFDTVADDTFSAATRARSVVLDAAGRIVVGAMRMGTMLWVGRFTTGGALDTSFGSGGWASAGASVSYSGATAQIALQSDGRIVAMGGSRVGDRTVQLVRFTGDGALDTTFGDAGAATTIPVSDVLLGLAIAADDSVLFGALGRTATYLGRLGRDGAADAAFAGDGSLETPTSAGYDRALAALVLPDGRIVLGGTASALNLGALVRLMPDGTLDPSFGTEGRVARAPLDAVTSMALDASGRVLIGGPSSSLRVVRLLPDGRTDTSFGSAGDFSVGSSDGAGMAVGADGRVYVAGYARAGLGMAYMGVKRLLEDGTADPAYGTGGETLVPVSSSPIEHAVLAVQPDGGVVVSGRVLVRLDADGALDATFGTGGMGVGGANAHAIAIRGDGLIMLAWRDWRPGEESALVVERRLTDGSLDPSFGDAGSARVPLGVLASPVAGLLEPLGLSLEADGTILLATTSGDAGGLRHHATLVRLTSDGALDASFGTGGRRVLVLGSGSSALHAMVRDADGATLLLGRAFGDATATSEMMALRLR